MKCDVRGADAAPLPCDGCSDRPPRAKVLVVDDAPTSRRLLQHVLGQHYEVLDADNGQDALAICMREQPDLVLLDVAMPDVDGHEVCRRLKADPVTRDVPVIFVTASAHPVHEERGLAAGAVDFIAKPINRSVVLARVRTHLDLARTRALLSATLDATADGILVTTAAGEVRTMNSTLRRMWQLPPTLVAQRCSRDIVAAMQAEIVDLPAWRAGLRHALSLQPGEQAFDDVVLRGDRHLERHATPLCIHGRANGHVFSYREVTERRRAERALKQLNETLEARIAERTRALEAATRLANQASKAKSEFLSNISHEIRTPVNAVIGMTYLAQRADPAPQQRAYLDKIQSAAGHLLRLLDDVLDFSKIEAGALQIDDTTFRLSEIVDGIASQGSDAASAKGLALSFDVDPALDGPLRGDPLRLRQILLNFVSNALKFTERGRIDVTARASSDARGRLLARFEVRDTGIGIEDGQCERLFRAFEQADSSTSRRYGGTGLGLAISKRLAVLMGGAVGASGRPGEGSVFWFTARVERAAQDGDATQEAQPCADALRSRLAGARVLVAEDNPLNQEVTAGLLQEAGVQVQTVADGRSALELLRSQRFDCVLMDVHMPVMDGLQAAAAIRADPALSAMPLVAMTADVGTASRRRCEAAGMRHFIGKPADPDQLYTTLANAIGTRAPHSPAQSPAQSPARSPAPAALPTWIEHCDDPASVDLRALWRAVGGNESKARRYAALFEQTLAESVDLIVDAAASERADDAMSAAHRLKSSARMVGAGRLADLCQRLEDGARQFSRAQLGALTEQMTLLSRRISADIRKALS